MSTAELVKALAAAQAEFGAIEKTSENRHFGSKYADLAAVLNTVRPVLAAHGIALVQVIVETEHGTSLVTKLLHESGELSSSMPLFLDGLTSQQIGSAMTYARRYCALAICGVHPADDDDDGNAASETRGRRTQGRDEMLDEFKRLTTAHGIGTADARAAFVEAMVGRPEKWSRLSFAEKADVVAKLEAITDGDLVLGKDNAGRPMVYPPGEEPFDVPTGAQEVAGEAGDDPASPQGDASSPAAVLASIEEQVVAAKTRRAGKSDA